MGGRGRDGYFQREPSVMKRLGVIKFILMLFLQITINNSTTGLQNAEHLCQTVTDIFQYTCECFCSSVCPVIGAF